MSGKRIIFWSCDQVAATGVSDVFVTQPFDGDLDAGDRWGRDVCGVPNSLCCCAWLEGNEHMVREQPAPSPDTPGGEQ